MDEFVYYPVTTKSEVDAIIVSVCSFISLFIYLCTGYFTEVVNGLR